MDCSIYVVKTKALISCAVTAQLIVCSCSAPLFSHLQKASFLMTRLICMPSLKKENALDAKVFCKKAVVRKLQISWTGHEKIRKKVCEQTDTYQPEDQESLLSILLFAD